MPAGVSPPPPPPPPPPPLSFTGTMASTGSLRASPTAGSQSTSPPDSVPVSSSRNDLFTKSWKTLPPKGLYVDVPRLQPLPHLSPLLNPLASPPASPVSPSNPPPPSKTSSFFASAAADTPPPAPRLPSISPSPLSLSRASSLRARALPPRTAASPPPADSPSALLSPVSPTPLSPLHQSPNLPPATTWDYPRPPSADDISLRLDPDPTYLLGEGRYACVYLAAYKRPESEWTLCAAKRLAADRESQTLGLREAFFLNRLGADSGRGKVYIVKLIAVKEIKEANEGRGSHMRSVSDDTETVISATPSGSPLRRPRSSTTSARRQEPTQLTIDTERIESAARLVLVLEHAPLGTVDRLLRTSPALVGPQLWGRWAREAAEALEWVHSHGIVHADVKPANLLLTADLHVRLSDFGSSLLIHPSHPPTDGVGLGTLPFSSPELVDASAPFSFPADIFALGATLYQCLTGREPYRGSRPVEMMHHVRNGSLWVWAERERLSLVGTASNTPSGSPYPSARDEPVTVTVKRGGSLRVPSKELRRVGSVESLKAADDVMGSYTPSPSGVKLWHQWKARGTKRPGDLIDRLIRPDDQPPSPPASPTLSRTGSLRKPSSPLSRTASRPSPTSPMWPPSPAGYAAVPATVPEGDFALYEDGSPAMFFLGEPVRVPDDVRDVIRAMLDPDPEGRPTASEIICAWDELKVGVEDEGVEDVEDHT